MFIFEEFSVVNADGWYICQRGSGFIFLSQDSIDSAFLHLITGNLYFDITFLHFLISCIYVTGFQSISVSMYQCVIVSMCQGVSLCQCQVFFLRSCVKVCHCVSVKSSFWEVIHLLVFNLVNNAYFSYALPVCFWIETTPPVYIHLFILEIYN